MKVYYEEGNCLQGIAVMLCLAMSGMPKQKATSYTEKKKIWR